MQWRKRGGQNRSHTKVVFISFLCILAVCTFLFSSCSDTGACVGSGGVLLSPECKEGWSKEECDQWDAEEINGANWNYYGGSCADQGYTEECSDGSFRLPGQC